MTLQFTVGDRFLDAAREWGDSRLMDAEEALEAKAEQALLEIEHLVSGAHEVSFAVDLDDETGEATIAHEPSDELSAFLAAQSEESGLDEATLLKLHVDLFAQVFLEEDTKRPPNAPPEE